MQMFRPKTLCSIQILLQPCLLLLPQGFGVLCMARADILANFWWQNHLVSKPKLSNWDGGIMGCPRGPFEKTLYRWKRRKYHLWNWPCLGIAHQKQKVAKGIFETRGAPRTLRQLIDFAQLLRTHPDLFGGSQLQEEDGPWAKDVAEARLKVLRVMLGHFLGYWTNSWTIQSLAQEGWVMWL